MPRQPNRNKEQTGIKTISQSNPYPEADAAAKRVQPRRLSSYFVVLMLKGSLTYNLDLQDIKVEEGQLLFAMPNQVLVPPPVSDTLQYVKVLFDENTLTLLPQSFPFLLNPANNQIIVPDDAARKRLTILFGVLNQLYCDETGLTDTELLLSYLHTLLTELNSLYFKHSSPASELNPNLAKFIEFKLMVESHLSSQPTVIAMAQKLALSTNSLYRIVREQAGVSPKDYFSKRLLVEAQRKLLYSDISVKELAYELGFNDPDYFSRFFKKSTGKSITEFVKQPKDLSGQ